MAGRQDEFLPFVKLLNRVQLLPLIGVDDTVVLPDIP
jgi:hypothetical protein